MKLTVDSREPKELIELLQKKEIEVVEQMLDVGDYVYVAEDPTKSFVVERKTWDDFIKSFTEEKPRLFEQLQNLKLNHVTYRPILIIVGSKWQALTKTTNPQRMIHGVRGVRASVSYSYQIPTIDVDDNEEFVETLLTLIKQAESPPGERPVEFRKRNKTVREIEENMLTAVKGIGMKTAKKLLDEFVTVKNVVVQDKQTLEISVGVSVGEKLYNTINGIEMEKIKKNARRIPRRRN